MFDIDWMGLALPFAYLAVLASALMTFSTIYRKRKAGKANYRGPTPLSQGLLTEKFSRKRQSGSLVRTQSSAKHLPLPPSPGLRR